MHYCVRSCLIAYFRHHMKEPSAAVSVLIVDALSSVQSLPCGSAGTRLRWFECSLIVRKTPFALTKYTMIKHDAFRRYLLHSK